ncbi:MAG: Heavy metal binding domain [Bacteroidota bacterium]|jgi:hypothetical protein
MKIIFLGVLLAFASCTLDMRNNTENSNKDTTMIKTGQKVYECPMKCENKTYSDTGKCTICGMDLVLKK